MLLEAMLYFIASCGMTLMFYFIALCGRALRIKAAGGGPQGGENWELRRSTPFGKKEIYLWAKMGDSGNIHNDTAWGPARLLRELQSYGLGTVIGKGRRQLSLPLTTNLSQKLTEPSKGSVTQLVIIAGVS